MDEAADSMQSHSVLGHRSSDHRSTTPFAYPPTTYSSAIPRDLPPDRRDSSHPIERLIANGQILEQRWSPQALSGEWRHELIVRSDVQDRLLFVREDWSKQGGSGHWIARRRDSYIADQIILRTIKGVTRKTLQSRIAGLGMKVLEVIAEDLYTVRLPRHDLDAHQDAQALLASIPDVVSQVEPDGVGFGAGIPNDASFAQQWGHHNTGQSGGTVNADVDAPEFWDIIESAPGIVIAVLDTGLNLTHPDL